MGFMGQKVWKLVIERGVLYESFIDLLLCLKLKGTRSSNRISIRCILLLTVLLWVGIIDCNLSKAISDRKPHILLRVGSLIAMMIH